MIPSIPIIAACRFCENLVCNQVVEQTKDHDLFRTFQVICDACKARGPVMRSESNAIAAWNRGVDSI